MRVIALAENTSKESAIGCEHGLSLFIETKEHRIVFDTGASMLFSKNAAVMDVNLSQADIAVISHGHADHGGGIAALLKCNDHAPIYIRRQAFSKLYANTASGGRKYIGLDKRQTGSGRFVYAEDLMTIDDTLSLFSAVPCLRSTPSGNMDLLRFDGTTYVQDDFTHEQNLVLRENGKTVLIAGCAHCGIVNILDRFHSIYGHYPNVVIGGFHLYNPVRDTNENPETIREIAAYLLETKAKFHTCHCTGRQPYETLKAIMGDSIAYLSGGQTLEI